MKNRSIIILLSTLFIAGCSGNSSSVPASSTTNNSTQTAAVQTNKTNQGQDPSKESAVAKQSTTSMPSQNSAPTNTSPSADKSQTSVVSTAPAQPVAKVVHQTPAATPAANQKAPVQQTVSFTIIGANHKTIVPKMDVPIKNDDTVLSILKEITREKGIQMEYRGSGAAAYVEGIDNVYEMDQGPKSGWMFRVNGNFGDRSCGVYAVHAGDVIQWLYTTNLGKDLGK
jgi:hypothetical protein